MGPCFNFERNDSPAPEPPLQEVRRLARKPERGAGHFKAILWLFAFAAFVYVMIKVVPVLVDNFQFQDGVQTIARFASATRQTPEQIRAAVLKEAQKDD